MPWDVATPTAVATGKIGLSQSSLLDNQYLIMAVFYILLRYRGPWTNAETTFSNECVIRYGRVKNRFLCKELLLLLTIVFFLDSSQVLSFATWRTLVSQAHPQRKAVDWVCIPQQQYWIASRHDHSWPFSIVLLLLISPDQYEDATGQLMMLPSDIVLISDPEFKKWVEVYAKDEDKFYSDFAKAFSKLLELGVPFPAGKPWYQFW